MYEERVHIVQYIHVHTKVRVEVRVNYKYIALVLYTVQERRVTDREREGERMMEILL